MNNIYIYIHICTYMYIYIGIDIDVDDMVLDSDRVVSRKGLYYGPLKGIRDPLQGFEAPFELI